MKRTVFFLVGALIIIAVLSNMPYEQQSIRPFLKTYFPNEPYKQFLSQFEINYWGRVISIESRGYVAFVEFLFRKGMHIVGYGIVTVIIFVFYRKLKWRFPTLLALITIFVIACLDELRQSFLPGRTGLFDDVKLDVLGGILFLAIANCIIFIKQFLKKFLKKTSKSF